MVMARSVVDLQVVRDVDTWEARVHGKSGASDGVDEWKTDWAELFPNLRSVTILLAILIITIR